MGNQTTARARVVRARLKQLRKETMATQPLHHITVPFRTKKVLTDEQLDELKDMMMEHLFGTALPVLGHQIDGKITDHKCLGHQHKSTENEYCYGCIDIAQNQEN